MNGNVLAKSVMADSVAVPVEYFPDRARISDFPIGLSYLSTETDDTSYPHIDPRGARGVVFTVKHNDARNFQIYSPTRMGGARYDEGAKMWFRSCYNADCYNWSQLISEHPDTGNVGIGVLDPKEKLHVSGRVLATAHLTPSDERLKTNIEPLQEAMEGVMKLTGVTYDWKDGEAAPEMGLIAQEVAQAFPYAVAEDENGYLSVDYSRLVVPLIESVKELSAHNEAQETRIAELEKIVAEMQALLEGSKEAN